MINFGTLMLTWAKVRLILRRLRPLSNVKTIYARRSISSKPALRRKNRLGRLKKPSMRSNFRRLRRSKRKR